MSATMPHSNRLTSRASRPGISLGGRSEVSDDLLAALVQRVERMEELLLGRFLAFQEVDVVHQEQIDVVAVALAELRHGAPGDALDHLVDELLGAHVQHPGVRAAPEHGVGDGLHQVGLAQPGGAVDEERVVGLAGGLDSGVGGGGGELVRLADDERCRSCSVR